MAFVSISSFLNYIFPLNTFILYNFAQKERTIIMKTRLSVTLVHLLFAVSAVMAQEQYNNPVINESLPDPTVIKADDGYFYLYATENIRNVPIYRSENLVDWRRVGTAFTDRTRPQMVPRGNIWAPDINLINGKYVMYYSKSTWGGEWECGIGVATADRPSGPFTDVGKLFISSEIGVQNSIDPFYIEEDDGSKYLFWGSFRGIYGIQLSDDGLSIKSGAQKVQIAGTLTEGTYIYKHDGYYYLFGSAGTCCEGLNSTYRVMVARSENLMGPYVNKSGRPALENNFMLVMQKSNKVVGPGHNSEIVQDDAGQYWMLYHGFDAADPDGGRKVYLDQILWDKDGWPIVRNRVPSATANAPVFNKETGIRDAKTDTDDTKAISTYTLGGLPLGYHTQPQIVIEQFDGGQSRKIVKK
jgi:arabinan endo-1,5-alpha-L-arabinosidase